MFSTSFSNTLLDQTWSAHRLEHHIAAQRLVTPVTALWPKSQDSSQVAPSPTTTISETFTTTTTRSRHQVNGNLDYTNLAVGPLWRTLERVELQLPSSLPMQLLRSSWRRLRQGLPATVNCSLTGSLQDVANCTYTTVSAGDFLIWGVFHFIVTVTNNAYDGIAKGDLLVDGATQAGRRQWSSSNSGTGVLVSASTASDLGGNGCRFGQDHRNFKPNSQRLELAHGDLRGG